MRTEEQVLALFAEANRIPDPASLDAELLAESLAVIQQGSSRMIQAEENRTKSGRDTRRRATNPWTIGISLAAVLAVLVGVVIALTNGDQPDVVDNPPPVVEPTLAVDTTLPAVDTTLPAVDTTTPETRALPVTLENLAGFWGSEPNVVMMLIDPVEGHLSIQQPQWRVRSDIDYNEGAWSEDPSAIYVSGTLTLDGNMATLVSDEEGLCDPGSVSTFEIFELTTETLEIRQPTNCEGWAGAFRMMETANWERMPPAPPQS